MTAPYVVKYYVTARGDCPFKTFLEGSQPKVQAKFIKILDLLAHQGPNLKRPYADMLRDGIRELRVLFSGNQYRALYFFIMGRHIVITHGILKNTDRVPPEEIDRALRYKGDLEMRLKRGEASL
jgi:phage-related protein